MLDKTAHAVNLEIGFEDKQIRAIYHAKDDPEKTIVIVHKTNDAGKGLPGAKFALYKNKNCAASDLVRELGPTDSNGKAESASFHIEHGDLLPERDTATDRISVTAG